MSRSPTPSPDVHVRARRGTTACALALPLVVVSSMGAAQSARRDDGEPAPPHLRAAAEEDATHVHEARMPDPAAGPDVSLAGIFAYADAHSPVLAVARSTRSRADAERVAAAVRVLTNPELTIAVGPRSGIFGRGVDVEAGLSQPIPIGGQRGRRLDAAARLRELTDAEIEQMRWAVHCDVHAAFHRALVEQARTRLAERVVTFQEDVLRVVDRQIAAGEVAPLALRLAQAEVAQARQVLVASRQAFLASRLRLAQLAGWPVTIPPMPMGELDDLRDPPAFDALLAVARARLPSLATGEARIREAEARAASALRAGWPQPVVGLQYRREDNPTSEGAYDIVLGTLTLPIPAFARNQGERARARADAEVASAELDAALRLLAGQIAEARSEVVAAGERARAYGAEIVPRFEESLSLLRRSFELGEIDILALSAGRERFLRIQSDALAAQLDYFVALAGLERVVGVDLWHDDHEELGP